MHSEALDQWLWIWIDFLIHWWFLSSLIHLFWAHCSMDLAFAQVSSHLAWLVMAENRWPHWFFARRWSIELTLSRRNNKNSSQSFFRRIVMEDLGIKIMAEIQRRIRFNTISMSILMITIAVGVMTAMWMYADSIVWFFKKLLGDILCCL